MKIKGCLLIVAAITMLLLPSCKMLSWTAPPEGGKVTVTVTVSDPSGGIAAKSIVFRVETCASCAF